MLNHLYDVKPARKTRRASSWDVTGGNADFWIIKAGETRVLATIDGPGIITHLWSCFAAPWRDLLLQFTWDDAPGPSINVPFGDFFGLGHGIVNSHQSFLFTTSTNYKNTFNSWCAHNSYVPMPFKKKAKVVLVNESSQDVWMWFYIDYELVPPEDVARAAYFHAEFHRELPFGGWGHDMRVNSPEVDSVVNEGRDAWENNHVILDKKGTGQYIGCNISITNLRAPECKDYGSPGYSWWGEGDDMIWVDGYKWPPDLHGTGSEDYFNQGLGLQPNAFMRNGASLYEFETGGYTTCYVHHLDNPVRFTKEIKVTIEVGHANQLGNEVSSVAYWYAIDPVLVDAPPPVACRRAVPKKDGKWFVDPATVHTTRHVKLSPTMKAMKNDWDRSKLKPYQAVIGEVIAQKGANVIIKARGTVLGPGGTIDVTLQELIDEFLPTTAVASVESDTRAGELSAGKDGRVVLTPRSAKGKPVIMDDLLRDLDGKRVKIIFGKLLPEEKQPGEPAEHVLKITTKVNFRE